MGFNWDTKQYEADEVKKAEEHLEEVKNSSNIPTSQSSFTANSYNNIKMSLETLTRDQLEQLRNSIDTLCPRVSRRLDTIADFGTVFYKDKYYTIEDSDYESISDSYILTIRFDNSSVISQESLSNNDIIINCEDNQEYYFEDDEDTYIIMKSVEVYHEDYDHEILIFFVDKKAIKEN